jgi:anti-sigma factor RsiW
MNCHSFTNVLDLFAEGRLSPRRVASARAHLSACAACRALAAPAPAAPSASAPEALKARLLRAVRAAAAAPSAKNRVELPLWPREAPAIALAAVALALVGLLIAASGVPSQRAGGALAAAGEEP